MHFDQSLHTENGYIDKRKYVECIRWLILPRNSIKGHFKRYADFRAPYAIAVLGES